MNRHHEKLGRFGAGSRCGDHDTECDSLTYRERVQITGYTCGCVVVVLPSGVGINTYRGDGGTNE